MTSCRDIAERADSLAEGGLDPALRRELEAHLAGCPQCQAFVAQLDLTSRALRALPPPELPADLRAALLGAVEARLAGPRPVEAATPFAAPTWGLRRLGWEAAFATVGAAALVVGMARHPSRAVGDWGLAAALVVVALGLAALVRRLTLRFAAAAVSASLVAAALGGGAGPLELPTGEHCLLTVVAAAAGVTAVAWLATRRGASRSLAPALGVWALAGAVAGDAALQVACGARDSLAHLLVFHAGGVALVALLALLAARLRPFRA
jgi:anti-sigma factor RsiW